MIIDHASKRTVKFGKTDEAGQFAQYVRVSVLLTVAPFSSRILSVTSMKRPVFQLGRYAVRFVLVGLRFGGRNPHSRECLRLFTMVYIE